MSEYEKYDGKVDIKTTGKNLFHTIEIGGIKYTDNIPDGMNIGITKEQYIEYEQLKEENKQLKSILTELEEWLKEQINQTLVPEGIVEVSYKIQALKEKYK